MSRIVQVIVNILGYVIIGASLYFGVVVYGKVEPMFYFLHLPSFLVVSGGIIGIAFCSYSVSSVCGVIRNLFVQSASRLRQNRHDSEKILAEACEVYYTEGGPGVKQYIDSKSCFGGAWREVGQRLEGKLPIADIRDLLHLRQASKFSDMRNHVQIVNKLASLAPSFGMFGTILGLIKLLANLQDFNSIGPNMSLALITTLYGILVSNILLMPLSLKLSEGLSERKKIYNQIDLFLGMIEDRKPSIYLESLDKGAKK